MTEPDPQPYAEQASSGMNRILRSGWFCLLPPSAIHLVSQVASAHAEGAVADLDTLLRPLRTVIDLDSPPDWEDHVDGADPHADPEEQRLNKQHHDDLAAGLAELGLPMPATMREVAHLLVRFGVLTREVGAEGERWRFADPIPYPEEVLPVRPEWLERAHQYRSAS
ncbi:DUF6042 family protein [Gandjariella thermophila]|uniref:DUF6042 family protein n=1 Tax=Gandjariella thermophila TaxID=1931992 RepID=UPI0027D99050|nr:DUF6042 family protein [Gandjariella thermophila]